MEGNKDQQNPDEFVDLDNIDAYEMPNPEGEAASDKQDLANRAQESLEDDRDSRSVFVKNVHFSAEKKEIEEHFNDCGEIKLITIKTDKMTH